MTKGLAAVLAAFIALAAAPATAQLLLEPEFAFPGCCPRRGLSRSPGRNLVRTPSRGRTRVPIPSRGRTRGRTLVPNRAPSLVRTRGRFLSPFPRPGPFRTRSPRDRAAASPTSIS